MRFAQYLVVIGLGLALSAPAKAEQFIVGSTLQTQNLLEICGSPSVSRANLDPCNMFILGVSDTLAFEEKICPPMEKYTLKAIALGRKYLFENPKLWHQHPSQIIKAALQEAFPC